MSNETTAAGESVDSLKSFRERLTRFRHQLARYIEQPDHDAIHDVRTAFRRMESAYQTLPGGCKTRSSQQYLLQAREFFNLNSRLRDCDVMMKKLKNLGRGSNSVQIRELKQERAKELRRALGQAKRLKTTARPRLRKPADGESLLRAQLHRRALRFLSNRPMVLAGEADSELVHTMRKDAKKLFYLMEQDPSLASLQQQINIRLFQRLSGDIHDADVLLEHLARRLEGDEDGARLLRILRIERHALYRELCGFLEDPQWQELASLGLATSPPPGQGPADHSPAAAEDAKVGTSPH